MKLAYIESIDLRPGDLVAKALTHHENCGFVSNSLVIAVSDEMRIHDRRPYIKLRLLGPGPRIITYVMNRNTPIPFKYQDDAIMPISYYDRAVVYIEDDDDRELQPGENTKRKN